MGVSNHSENEKLYTKITDYLNRIKKLYLAIIDDSIWLTAQLLIGVIGVLVFVILALIIR